MGNLFAKKKKYDLVGVNEELVAEEEQKKKKSESHFRTVKTLLPYLWPKGENFIRFCVILALTLMFFAKLCNVTVPIAYKHAVDILNDDSIKIIDAPFVNATNSGDQIDTPADGPAVIISKFNSDLFLFYYYFQVLFFLFFNF